MRVSTRDYNCYAPSARLENRRAFNEAERSAPNCAKNVVANMEGIDLFIDGHDHEVENAVVEDRTGKGVPVVETGCYLANSCFPRSDKSFHTVPRVTPAGRFVRKFAPGAIARNT